MIEDEGAETNTKARIDPARVVNMVEQQGQLALIAEFLLALPATLCDTPAVNGAIHKLLIARHDHVELLDRTRRHLNFDQIELARRLEAHELVQMRRVAVELYRANRRWTQALRISKRDLLFGDCIQTAALSGRGEQCEDLLKWFMEGDITGEQGPGVLLQIEDLRQLRCECFAAALFRCYRLLRIDVVLELAYLHGVSEYAMPFFIQSARHTAERIAQLEERVDSQVKDTTEMKKVVETKMVSGSVPPMMSEFGTPGPSMSMGAVGFDTFGMQQDVFATQTADPWS
jgi:clathrin heavy chain